MTMTQAESPVDVLVERLDTVAAVLGVRAPGAERDGAGGSSRAGGMDTLVDLVAHVRAQRSPAAAWLLVVGLTGAFPPAPVVRSVRRALALKEPQDAVVWLLSAVQVLAMSHGSARARLRVVQDRPLVDVDFTATSDVLTGIQRVVRGVVAQWRGSREFEAVAWTARGGAFRPLVAAERQRLFGDEDPRAAAAAAEAPAEIVVPWGVPVVVIEVPPEPNTDRLAAIAELTHNPVRVVGHDCIPISSAETVPLEEGDKFGRYLEMVKHADRLAAVSRSAAAEFRGFTRALSAQGLPGPDVLVCPLPHSEVVAGPSARSASRDTTGEDVAPARPLVVCIGSLGRRKNQVALVEAAELLWREGLDFEVRLLGHLGPEQTPMTTLVPELRELGRPLTLEPAVGDDRIVATLDAARCVVFPSLHEGFGLPVAEALSHGVPVITSDFGSLREVAEGQGALIVDPEDVTALADALRTVLTDDEVHARLVAEAAARPPRTWTRYADELWTGLLG